MAIEPRRGCGYRKVGGLYLVCDGPAHACHRLPIGVDSCPTCGAGIRPARGWAWVEPSALLGVCTWDSCAVCPVCHPDRMGARAGLLWVGSRYYATPRDFLDESLTLGVSRRIAQVPRGFAVGHTWVLLGHRDALPLATLVSEDASERPGIIAAFKPQRVEQVCRQSTPPDELRALYRRGITPVFVPDGDPDHDPPASGNGGPGAEEPAASVGGRAVAVMAEIVGPGECTVCKQNVAQRYRVPSPVTGGAPLHLCPVCVAELEA